MVQRGWPCWRQQSLNAARKGSSSRAAPQSGQHNVVVVAFLSASVATASEASEIVNDRNAADTASPCKCGFSLRNES